MPGNPDHFAQRRGGILILAAGSSRRFGADKRRAALPGGETLLSATVRSARASGLPCLLCLSPRDRADPPATDVPVHIAPLAARGMGATLASGAAEVSDWEFVLVALGDMPWIRPDSFLAVAAAAASNRIVIPTYAGRRGHPVAFGAAFLPALRELDGDSGGRAVIDARADAVAEIALDDAGILRDVDRPKDLRDTML